MYVLSLHGNDPGSLLTQNCVCTLVETDDLGQKSGWCISLPRCRSSDYVCNTNNSCVPKYATRYMAIKAATDLQGVLVADTFAHNCPDRKATDPARDLFSGSSQQLRLSRAPGQVEDQDMP